MAPLDLQIIPLEASLSPSKTQEFLNLTLEASRSPIRAREAKGLLDVKIVPLEETLRLPRKTVSFVTSQAPRQAWIRRDLLATM